jgi:lipoate-protein ligase A
MLEAPHEPHVNLALDEALLMEAACSRKIIVRLWRNSSAIVVGYSWTPKLGGVNLELARRLGIPVLRRISGGGPVYHDMGNLNYSVYIPADRYRVRELLTSIVRDVVSRVVEAITGVKPRIANDTDVVVKSWKVSGNAATARWGGVLVHGTLLVKTDPQKVVRLTPPPPKIPAGVDPVKYRPMSLERLSGRRIDMYDAIRAFTRVFGSYFGGLMQTSVRANVVEAAKVLARRHRDPDWVQGTKRLHHYMDLVQKAFRMICH